MKLTADTGIICPHCGEEVEIETSGLLGGILKQLFIRGVINRVKQEGAKITGKCGHTFHYKPDPQKST